MWIPQAIKNKNVQYKTSIIKNFITNNQKLLDFGTGDLMLAQKLKTLKRGLDITGVDTVDFKPKPNNIKFKLYNGKKLPFAKNTFDTVLSFHVFHHCLNPLLSIKECVRVSKNKLLVVEPVYRLKTEVYLMKLMDFFYNFWKDQKINLSYNFMSKSQLETLFISNGTKIIKCFEVDTFPKWIPIGRTYLYLLKKINK